MTDSASHTPEETGNNPTELPPELIHARRTIDNIDAALVHILAERFRCTQQVGVIKARYNLPPADPGREAQQVARLRKLACESGLDPDFSEKFLAFIVEEVIRHHVDIKTALDAGADIGDVLP